VALQIVHIGHELISGNLNEIISLNGVLELGATATGFTAVVAILKSVFILDK
jgi:hypothetical protein